MGIVSIIFAFIVLAGFTGVGCFAAGYIMNDRSMPYLLGLDSMDPTLAFALIVGLFFLIGFLFFMNLLMNGLIYNRLQEEKRERLERRERRRSRRAYDEDNAWDKED